MLLVCHLWQRRETFFAYDVVSPEVLELHGIGPSLGGQVNQLARLVETPTMICPHVGNEIRGVV